MQHICGRVENDVFAKVPMLYGGTGVARAYSGAPGAALDSSLS